MIGDTERSQQQAEVTKTGSARKCINSDGRYIVPKYNYNINPDVFLAGWAEHYLESGEINIEINMAVGSVGYFIRQAALEIQIEKVEVSH
jgi:hypothetical protein